MTYTALIQHGELKIQNDFTRQAFKKFLANHEGARIEFVPVLPESRKQRAFYHGAVVPVWCFLDGKDYRDGEILEQQHEIAKLEFNGAIVVSHGKTYKIGKSSKQKLSQGFLERVIDYLVKNYGINPLQVLNPEEYKKWRDEIYPYGGAENFIDYLIELNILKCSPIA